LDKALGFCNLVKNMTISSRIVDSHQSSNLENSFPTEYGSFSQVSFNFFVSTLIRTDELKREYPIHRLRSANPEKSSVKYFLLILDTWTFMYQDNGQCSRCFQRTQNKTTGSTQRYFIVDHCGGTFVSLFIFQLARLSSDSLLSKLS